MEPRSLSPRFLAVVVVALVVAAPATASLGGGLVPATEPARQAAPATIDGCTTITESGVYELTSTLRASTTGPCIHVRASDVTIDGNGNVVAGNGSGVGVLVYGGGARAVAGRDASVSNVTVRDLVTARWETGIRIGALGGADTEAAVRNVTARDNGAGVRLYEATNASVTASALRGNRVGATLWEVQDSRFADLTVAGNDRRGLSLSQVVAGNVFRDLTVARNGGEDRSAGVYVSTDATRNRFAGLRVRGNDGPGLWFTDSYGNRVLDSVVAANDGPGVLGSPANRDALRNVTVRGNAGRAVDHAEPSRSRFAARDLRLGAGISLSFRESSVRVDRVTASGLPDAPEQFARSAAVDLRRVDGPVSVTFPAADPSAVSLWQYDGSEWRELDTQTANAAAGTLSARVSSDGVVALLDADQQPQPDPEPRVLEILSTDEDNQFNYEVVVRGSASPTATEDVSADAGDTITENDDGTVTITGSTGSGAGDAFEVTGRVQSVEITGATSGFRVLLGGTDITDRVTGPGDDQPQPEPEPETFVVESTSDGDFGYIFVVDGEVEPTETEDVAADADDRVIENGDGTVTVIGSTGGDAGDAFTVTGEVVEFYTPAPATAYRLILDAVDVTDDIPEPNE